MYCFLCTSLPEVGGKQGSALRCPQNLARINNLALAQATQRQCPNVPLQLLCTNGTVTPSDLSSFNPD